MWNMANIFLNLCFLFSSCTLEYRINGGWGENNWGGLEMTRYNNNWGAGIIGGAWRNKT